VLVRLEAAGINHFDLNQRQQRPSSSPCPKGVFLLAPIPIRAEKLLDRALDA